VPSRLRGENGFNRRTVGRADERSVIRLMEMDGEQNGVVSSVFGMVQTHTTEGAALFHPTKTVLRRWVAGRADERSVIRRTEN
jgi:hypothetical protein